MFQNGLQKNGGGGVRVLDNVHNFVVFLNGFRQRFKFAYL